MKPMMMAHKKLITVLQDDRAMRATNVACAEMFLRAGPVVAMKWTTLGTSNDTSGLALDPKLRLNRPVLRERLRRCRIANRLWAATVRWSAGLILPICWEATLKHDASLDSPIPLGSEGRDGALDFARRQNSEEIEGSSAANE